jgi:hypothetical protein
MPLKPIKSAATYPCPPGFNGRLAGLYRWLSGRPLNGHRYTNATGFRYGTVATDISGYATWYQFLPGYRRFLVARLPVMATPVIVAMAIVWPVAILVATQVILLAMARPVAMARRGHLWRRDVLEPLAMSVATVAKIKHVAGHGHRWVTVARDFRDVATGHAVAIRFPVGWVGEEGSRGQVAKVVADRLSAPDMVATWSLAGRAPTVTFTMPAKPPAKASLADMAMPEDVPASELAAGLGARGQVAIDLAMESPHALIAAASGAGKSELLAFLVGQLMRRGYGVACLDAKFTSHMWLRRIPGVLYASESEELHEALIWLDAELLRRARLISSGGNPDTLIPLVVVLEEMNAASNRLRAYWRSIKGQGDPMMSPALTALGNLSSMGRELRMHILMAGQSLSAKATAGAENRENFGIRLLARATANQWRMLAPQIKPAPLGRGPSGRWHLVVGDSLRELQAPFMDIKHKEAELIAWATGAAPIPDVPGMMLGLMTTTCENEEAPWSETVSSVPGTGLSEYVATRPGLTLTQLQNWRHRHAETFPEPVGKRGRAILYDEAALDVFVMSRVGE